MGKLKKTEEGVAQARSLFRQGMNFTAIGRSLGVRSDTVRSWLDHAGRDRSHLIVPPAWRNQHMSPDLPTLPYVPGISVSKTSKYQMISGGH